MENITMNKVKVKISFKNWCPTRRCSGSIPVWRRELSSCQERVPDSTDSLEKVGHRGDGHPPYTKLAPRKAFTFTLINFILIVFNQFEDVICETN